MSRYLATLTGLYGFENGEVTKSILSVMVKSIAGKYRDIICMSPIHNLNAEKLSTVWRNCLKVATEIGYKVVVTMTDGLEANARFFRLVSGGNLMMQNPYAVSQIIFFLFDTVHLFKNIYCNFMNYGTYTCPSFDNPGKTITGRFDHLKDLYKMELGDPMKRAHKLNDTVLHPSSVEKTNVMLADSCFHESTIVGLKHWGKRGFPQFLETAEILSIFRTWFNFFNVKSQYDGQRTRDPNRNPINSATMEDSMIYLTKFIQWLEDWRDSGKAGLSRNTFSALLHTMKGFRATIPYLVSMEELDYIRNGEITSDPLEGRFRWWRGLNGANYLNSGLSLLRAEKMLRIRSLVKDGFDMKTIQSFFTVEENDNLGKNHDESEHFIENLDDFRFNVPLTNDEKSLVFYYAGYIAKSLVESKSKGKSGICSDCKQMIKGDSSTISVDIPEEEYTALINRGGLCRPSELLIVIAVHAWMMWCFIRDTVGVKDEFMKLRDQKAVFVDCFVTKLEQLPATKPILEAKCKTKHPFILIVRRIVSSVFNCIMVNLTKELNGVIHSQRKRKVTKETEKRTSEERKILKLTSGGAFMPSDADCGECKFCKDKKKFGGKGTLKKKCIQKS